MSPSRLLVDVVGGIVAVFVLRAGAKAMWWGIGSWLVRRAGPRPLRASSHQIWKEPGPIAGLDPATGPGGADGLPRPPFVFLKEHLTGSQPCVAVRDARGRVWRVKWGPEARSEAFAVRFAWSCGYFAEITHFIASGTIEGSTELRRAQECVAADGSFRNARFELEDPSVKKMFEEHSWSWADNPFVGSRELSGLKIVVMLLSNWDTKDRRDVARGSNTAIFEHHIAGRREAWYLVTDWGGSMGKWGASIVTRGHWDPQGFADQTPQFVSGIDNGYVVFGYTGQRTADIAADIPLEHVRWFHRYVDRLDEKYLMTALTASGASSEEATQFARALSERIRQLGRIVSERLADEVDELSDRFAVSAQPEANEIRS